MTRAREPIGVSAHMDLGAEPTTAAAQCFACHQDKKVWSGSCRCATERRADMSRKGDEPEGIAPTLSGRTSTRYALVMA